MFKVYNNTNICSFAVPNILKKSNGQPPTIPMFTGGDIPSYSPPARSFFTPPLPPEYQHPFADKPTLRGTNNEGGVVPNTSSYINRRPIPPPSLMPGHERIPFRPPDLVGGVAVITSSLSGSTSSPVYPLTTSSNSFDSDANKALNTMVNGGVVLENVLNATTSSVSSINSPSSSGGMFLDLNNNSVNNSYYPEVRKEVLPSIRRILSGSNGRKGDIPEVLLKQVTTRPNSYHHPPSSPVVLIDSGLLNHNEGSVHASSGIGNDNKQNINKIKNMHESDSGSYDEEQTKITMNPAVGDNSIPDHNITSTPSAAAAIGGQDKAKAVSAAVATSTTSSSSDLDFSPSASKNSGSSSSTSSVSSSTSSSTLAAASAHATWSLAWNVHVYLSVILFTILAVYSFYKMITYNKLTHLFSQSYFLCIHLILIIICATRTFYLCYDAYNIHSSFHIFVSEILLNLPATFLTISFAVLILFLSLKSLNHKNNRYSALIRPLTVVVGCGVHVVLCITLHYVESYTLQNHQQHLYYQQQQQLLSKRQQQQQQNLHYNYFQSQYAAANIVGLETMAFSSSSNAAGQTAANFHHHNLATGIATSPTPPPRVLSLICQIIYIFVCFSLGLLYLYLYRILKRILRSKSQNYIHGYQNLSYAIHITIATALLFVLLAALQIFGAISISSTRPLITQKTAEIDWLQWGYQFSLRLIEIAIITLISWVTGLKTSDGNNTVNINMTNNETRGGVGTGVTGQVNNTNSMFNTNLSINPGREKHSVPNTQYNHSNMTNFFLPCTSSSSQEQFETDYPAVCNANTNLHTYTMRTGKLIYDDSFALNSLSAPNTNSAGHHPHPQQTHHHANKQQQHQSTYQHPYDSQSLHSSAHHNVSEYGSRINYQPENHLQYNDYLTDNTTDHYENPNFDLRGSGSATSGSALVVNTNVGSGGVGAMQKFAKSSVSNSTTASSSNNSNMGSNSSSGSSATSQQQMLLLQGGGNETCYSEPLHENYDFNNFEKPKFKQQTAHDNWPDSVHMSTLLSTRDVKKKSLSTLERCTYDKAERRSSNSTHSCNSNTNSNNGAGVGSRYASFNTFERAPFNNVRKSDTFNNIAANGLIITHGRNNSSSSANSATSGVCRNTPTAVQTLASTERHHHNIMPARNLRTSGSTKVITQPASALEVFSRSTIERSSNNHIQQRPINLQSLNQPQQLHHQYSDEDDDDKDDDIMLQGNIYQEGHKKSFE